MKGVDIESLRGFLDGLRPQLELARKVESELDRRMARRFNVLDYISTSELGLSRVIADLLNPNAAHGQGVLFLDLLLRGLKLDFKAKHARVETEYTIRINGRLRRLDILVVVESQDDRRCLAIENKPYAEDGSGQVRDYLDYLRHEYERDGAARHCLIYLSGSGEMPEKSSVTLERLEQEKAHGGFAVMSYCRDTSPSVAEGDDDALFLPDYTLADWFRDCRRACDVDRLRWFLGDAEAFCRRRFGGNTMDATGDHIDEVLMRQLGVVAEVARRWPGIRAEVLKRFGDGLKERVEKKLGFDVRCAHTLSNPALPRYHTGISVYRTSWELKDQSVSIRAEAGDHFHKGMDWIIGVGTLARDDAGEPGRQEMYESLRQQLADTKVLGTPDRVTKLWPWIKKVEKEWRLWDDDMVVKLARKPDALEDYFVTRFCQIFEAAKDSIDKAVAEARGRGG